MWRQRWNGYDYQMQQTSTKEIQDLVIGIMKENEISPFEQVLA